jgi:hypothetical protein
MVVVFNDRHHEIVSDALEGRCNTMSLNGSASARRRLGIGLLGAPVVAGRLAVSGCQSNGDNLDLAMLVENVEPADALYNQGLANLNAGRLNEAPPSSRPSTASIPIPNMPAARWS